MPVEFKKLRALLDGLGAATSRFDLKLENISHTLEGMLEVSNRSQILEWISTISYTSHHERISEGRLDGTCEWILARSEYRNWRDSSVSKLLLLRGIRKLAYLYIMHSCLTNSLFNSRGGKNLHCVSSTQPLKHLRVF